MGREDECLIASGSVKAPDSLTTKEAHEHQQLSLMISDKLSPTHADILTTWQLMLLLK